MSWDAGRKRDFAGFTYVPPSTPIAPQTDITGQLPNQENLNDDGLHWHFGFPTALLTAPLRHYQWGMYRLHAWFGKLHTVLPVYIGYMFNPSTEQFYRGSQTRNPLQFTSLSAVQARDPNSADCVFCGTTEDGTLWAWGRNRNVINLNGLGVNEDFPREITHAGSGSASTKNVAYQPQPLYGENDELVNVRFVKAVASGLNAASELLAGSSPMEASVVALSDAGDMYAFGSRGSPFGDGDYYTPRRTGGNQVFSYPKLIKGWGLTFGFVDGVFTGTPVERPPKVWVDFTFARPGFRAVDNAGVIYTAPSYTETRRTKPGGTYRLRVTENGRGYIAAPTVTATASPTGDTMTLTAAVSTFTPSGSGVEFTVTNWGSGYATPPTITVSAPTGAGTKVTATVVVDNVLPMDNKWKKLFSGDFGVYAINDVGELFLIDITNGFLIQNQFDRLHDTVKFTKCAVGDAFLVALAEDGGVWTMGTANNGTASSRSTLQLLDAGPWVDIAAGAGHGVMLKANGEAWTWGQNAWGQLGIGSVTNSTTPVKVAGNAKWKRIFSGRFCTLATRDEELDALGNKLNPLTYTG